MTARWRARGAAAVGLGIVTAGCSITQSLNDMTQIEYKSATQGPRLDIPPDLVTPRADDRYVVPDRPSTGTTYSDYTRTRQTAAPGPAGQPVLPAVPGVRLERQGSQRWLIVDQPPEKIWPVLRSFWSDSGFALRLDSPETGIMETDWAESRPRIDQGWIRNTLGRSLNSLYATGERDRFRTRLETDGKVTEVFVTHRGLTEDFTGGLKETTVWVPRPSDPELEAEFLRRIMVRLAPSEAKVAAAAPSPAAGAAAGGATAVEAPAKARLVDVQGQPQVELTETFDRSWRQVGLALDRSGFTVEDRDRSKGTFFVRYVDPQAAVKPQGVLDRVLGVAPQKDLSGTRFRIVLSEAGSGSRVGVLGDDGQPPTSDADRRMATQIATVLRDQLR
jgi:outer membrane protein assembly factor BamC